MKRFFKNHKETLVVSKTNLHFSVDLIIHFIISYNIQMLATNWIWITDTYLQPLLSKHLQSTFQNEVLRNRISWKNIGPVGL